MSAQRGGGSWPCDRQAGGSRAAQQQQVDCQGPSDAPDVNDAGHQILTLALHKFLQQQQRLSYAAPLSQTAQGQGKVRAGCRAQVPGSEARAYQYKVLHHAPACTRWQELALSAQKWRWPRCSMIASGLTVPQLQLAALSAAKSLPGTGQWRWHPFVRSAQGLHTTINSEDVQDQRLD